MTTEGTGIAAASAMIEAGFEYSRFGANGGTVKKSPVAAAGYADCGPSPAAVFSAQAGAKFSFIDALNQSKCRKI